MVKIIYCSEHTWTGARKWVVKANTVLNTLVVCVCLCVRSGAGTGGKELAKKGTKMCVKDEVLTLSEIFLAFFEVRPRLGSVQGASHLCPMNLNGDELINMKSYEKAEMCNAHVLRWQARWGVKGAAVTCCPPVVQRVRAGESSETQFSCPCRVLRMHIVSLLWPDSNFPSGWKSWLKPLETDFSGI